MDDIVNGDSSTTDRDDNEPRFKRASETQVPKSGMDAMYHLLLDEKAPWERTMQDFIGLQAFSKTRTQTYLQKFHHRWPILHILSFDIATVPFPPVVSVCIIGTWLSPGCNRNERHNALRSHDVLPQRYLQDLTDPRLTLTDRPWPINLFQTVLLTLIFSLYRTNIEMLSRALLLRCMLIIILRQLRMLSGETIAQHLNTHFYDANTIHMLNIHERFKRLAVSTYQFDFQFAYTHGRPPILHRQEICVNLTSTFALWNAQEIDVYRSRSTEEPNRRLEIQVSAMTSSPVLVGPYPILVEDILLGLGGTLQNTWLSREIIPKGKQGQDNAISHRAILLDKLYTWTDTLDSIIKSINGNTTIDDASYLLPAYRAEDDCIVTAQQLISALLRDGAILSGCVRVSLCASLDQHELVQEVETSEESRWEMTRRERQSLACALKLLEKAGLSASPCSCTHPLASRALDIGLSLTRRILTFSGKCDCLSEGSKPVTENDLHWWFNVGGSLRFHGIAVFIRQLDVWTGKFERAISGEQSVFERADDSTSPWNSDTTT